MKKVAADQKELGLRIANHFESDINGVSSEILSALSACGRPLVFGGLLRDLAWFGAQDPGKDIDFVLWGADSEAFDDTVARLGAVKNRWGGYRLNCFKQVVDVWRAEATYAHTQGWARVDLPKHLLRTTLFDCDAILYDPKYENLLLPSDYLTKLHCNTVDMNPRVPPSERGRVLELWAKKNAVWKADAGPLLRGLMQGCSPSSTIERAETPNE
jgi:hypothetical protein